MLVCFLNLAATSYENQMIKTKWLFAKWYSGEVFISHEGIFFLEDGTILKKEYHYGICYRAKGSSRRYYWNKLNKDKKLISKALRVKVSDQET